MVSLKLHKRGYVYLYPSEQRDIGLIITALKSADNNQLSLDNLEKVCRRIAIEQGYERINRQTLNKNLWMLASSKPTKLRIWQHKRLRVVKLLATKK